VSQVPVGREMCGETPTWNVFTWGACRRGYLHILHPRRVDTAEFRRSGVVDLGFAKLKLDIRDSNKNYNREVTIVDVREPVIVRYFGAGSCNPKTAFDKVYLVEKVNGSINLKELEVLTEEVEEVVGKFKRIISRRYVVLGEEKVVLDEKKVGEEVIREKLVVNVKVDGDVVTVSGDTYHIKEDLKRLGFRWDPNKKVWFAKGEVEKVKAELESLGVSVVE